MKTKIINPTKPSPRPHHLLAFLLIVFLCPSTLPRAHGADIGLTPNKPAAAETNYDKFQKALTAGKTITLPPGDIYLDPGSRGPLLTPATVSCGRAIATTSGGYSIDPTPRFGKIGTRILWQGKGPFLRICGAGFMLNGPVELIGDGASDAIQVEGRADPATGRHIFQGVIFRNWGTAIHALAEPSENHADNSRCFDCEATNVGCVFRSDNQQAVNWHFSDLIVNILGGPERQIVCDINRGGKVILERLVICHPHVTIFRVRDYSPNTCRLVANDLEMDRYGFPCSVTLFEYAGPEMPDMKFMKWSVRASGFISPSWKIEGEKHTQLLDNSKWLNISATARKNGFNLSDIKSDVVNIPGTKK